MRRGVARFAVLAALTIGAASIAGCGGPSDDLFVVQRSGAIPGARLALLVSDNGDVRCNGSRHRMSDAQLLRARQLQRDLSLTATAGLSLPPGAQSILTYSVRTPSGTVRFSDSSPGQTKALYTLGALVRELARSVCGLPR